MVFILWVLLPKAQACHLIRLLPIHASSMFARSRSPKNAMHSPSSIVITYSTVRHGVIARMLMTVYSALYHVVKNGFVATPGPCETAAVGHIYSTSPVPYFSGSYR